MSGCADIKERLSEYLDGELEQQDAGRVGSHLAACGECREELGRIRAAAAAVKALPRLRAPEGFAAKIRARTSATASRNLPARRPAPRFSFWIPTAAAALLALSVGASFATHYWTEPAGESAASPGPARVEADRGAAAEADKAEGERRVAENAAKTLVADPAAPLPAKPGAGGAPRQEGTEATGKGGRTQGPGGDAVEDRTEAKDSLEAQPPKAPAEPPGALPPRAALPPMERDRKLLPADGRGAAPAGRFAGRTQEDDSVRNIRERRAESPSLRNDAADASKGPPAAAANVAKPEGAPVAPQTAGGGTGLKKEDREDRPRPAGDLPVEAVRARKGEEGKFGEKKAEAIEQRKIGSGLPKGKSGATADLVLEVASEDDARRQVGELARILGGRAVWQHGEVAGEARREPKRDAQGDANGGAIEVGRQVAEIVFAASGEGKVLKETKTEKRWSADDEKPGTAPDVAAAPDPKADEPGETEMLDKAKDGGKAQARRMRTFDLRAGEKTSASIEEVAVSDAAIEAKRTGRKLVILVVLRP